MFFGYGADNTTVMYYMRQAVVSARRIKALNPGINITVVTNQGFRPPVFDMVRFKQNIVRYRAVLRGRMKIARHRSCPKSKIKNNCQAMCTIDVGPYEYSVNKQWTKDSRQFYSVVSTKVMHVESRYIYDGKERSGTSPIHRQWLTRLEYLSRSPYEVRTSERDLRIWERTGRD